MRLPASFRDPDGWVFTRDGELYRQIDRAYQPNYDRLMGSGLYEALVRADLLVPHEEVPVAPERPETCYKVLKPERLRFISYPYEWCFSQLKHQALALLSVQKTALEHGMSLRDATAFNMQFRRGRPALMDTSSFEEYAEGRPWPAYRQFCQHFLAPLLLVRYRHADLGRLTRIHLDGVPLDLASRLLPLRARLRPGVLAHVVAHAALQKSYARRKGVRLGAMSRRAMLALVDNLESAVARLNWRPKETAWSGYYEHTNYSAEALAQKRAIVEEFLDRLKPATVWDLGGATGLFSRIASGKGVFTVSLDADPVSIERSYLDAVAQRDENLLPLVMDLMNPSAACGWANRERQSLSERGPADAALALALVHHLAIANNVPLGNVAAWLGDTCRSLVIEFVPKEDSQVQTLLATRKDIFGGYTQAGFEAQFRAHFRIVEARPIAGSLRTLYLMQKGSEK
ncbi:MAG: SAM-dependent methyltransferase [Candidatus Brocadiia bacterium]